MRIINTIIRWFDKLKSVPRQYQMGPSPSELTPEECVSLAKTSPINDWLADDEDVFNADYHSYQLRTNLLVWLIPSTDKYELYYGGQIAAWAKLSFNLDEVITDLQLYNCEIIRIDKLLKKKMS